MNKTAAGAICLLLTIIPHLTFGWTGKCVGVTDGDTITVMHGSRAEKIRLYGIDCPERGQDYGSRAKQFTSRMVFGKFVEVTAVDRDPYGRAVAWVSIDGQSLNKELVRAGLAWWYRRYARKQSELAGLEAEARRNKVGLWSQRDPVPPWDFRRKPKSPGKWFHSFRTLNRQAILT